MQEAIAANGSDFVLRGCKCDHDALEFQTDPPARRRQQRRLLASEEGVKFLATTGGVAESQQLSV